MSLSIFNKIRFTIKTRFLLLLLMLSILPIITYRFAIDFHRLLLENQATIQKQTVINIAYSLANKTDLIANKINKKSKNTPLDDLNLDKSILWIVNEGGKVTYAIGETSANDYTFGHDYFTKVGFWLIQGTSKFIPFTIPYPYPQSTNPEKVLIAAALEGKTYQQYRMEDKRPTSLMSATPIKIKDKLIGAVIIEESMGSLLRTSLKRFYRVVGVGGMVFIFVFTAVFFYTASISRRVSKLDYDIKNTFDNLGKVNENNFTDAKTSWFYQDELSALRHHIFSMLKQLSSYERYLKKLPVTLRHELHNPLNRLSMSLSLLEKDIDHKQIQYSIHALKQLKQIISSLSEATSIEESLSNQTPEPFPVDKMLTHYAENIKSLIIEHKVEHSIKLPEDTMVIGDGFMLEQLLDKLISNAKDFDDKSAPIKIDANLISNKLVHLMVSNHGQPLPEELGNNIFDGMISLRETNSDEQTHLGLGLYIVKLIADFHNGKVEANNILNQQKEAIGVEISIFLPVKN